MTLYYVYLKEHNYDFVAHAKIDNADADDEEILLPTKTEDVTDSIFVSDHMMSPNGKVTQ